MGAREASAHLMNSIRLAAAPLTDQGRDAVVPVILDGENAWEGFEKNGRDFLRRFYDSLQKDSQIEPVTISEAIARQKPQTFGPVSYTHLDVYKRQGPVRPRGMHPRGQLEGPGIEAEDRDVAKAVLVGVEEFVIVNIVVLAEDVYKRQESKTPAWTCPSPSAPQWPNSFRPQPSGSRHAAPPSPAPRAGSACRPPDGTAGRRRTSGCGTRSRRESPSPAPR